LRISLYFRNPPTFVSTKIKRAFMALSHPDAISDSDKNRLRAPLRSYFARHRLAVYVVLGALIALGVALSLNWLTGDGLLPLVVFVPCM
jgi:hypothetical protein